MNRMSEREYKGTDSSGGSMGYVLVLAGVAALGGLLFGYDTAVISGAIGFLRDRFQLDPWWTGWAASSALVGCIAGAASAGVLSDRLGRRNVLVWTAVAFFLSAVGSAVPRNLTEFILARILGGWGIGAASMLSPLYIAEVSPARIRGRLVSLNQLAIVSGMVIVYYVNAQIASLGDTAWNVTLGWRWMFGSEALPAAAFLVLLFFVPESPRWLTRQGREAEAAAVLARVGGSEHARQEMDEIRAAIAAEGGSLLDLVRPGVVAALGIAVALAIFQQITGINVVLYYAPEIFKSAGLDASKAINDTVLVGLVNMAFTLVAIWLVDRLGRKLLLLAGTAGMGASLALLGAAFYFHMEKGPWVLLCTLLYVASFASAMGPVVWVIMSEIFPTGIRGRAMSVATVCLWVFCYAVSQTFPVMLWLWGGAITFWFYAGICLAAILFIALAVPETKGKTLEEIERMWLRR